jgi:serine/threonine protein kinase/tetratricopeptide (TPR) repeat protein
LLSESQPTKEQEAGPAPDQAPINWTAIDSTEQNPGYVIGSRLSHYEILEKLGEGGMGVVYRALDLKLGREVALKVLPKELVNDRERRRRFEIEARAVAALNHPNIVTLHSLEEADGVYFLTMEHVDGVTLTAEIVEGGMPLDVLLKVAIDVTDALSSAHAKGVVHRDLKPANIMRDAGRRIKILDFGLARMRQSPVSESSESETEERTRAGSILGTMPYMSPEQLSGRSVDHRSDIFSLGIILFEMATGRRPFQGGSTAELIGSILRDDAASALGPAHPLRQIITRCLAKDPEQRYQSCLDVRKDLEDLQKQIAGGAKERSLDAVSSPRGGPALPPGIAATPKRFRGVYLAMALGLLASVVAALWLTRHRGPQNPESHGTTPIRSLAVLPFTNLSGDPAQDYLSEGFTDELTTTLCRLSALKVIARTSASSFRGTHDRASEIGSSLGVEGLITGSVLRAGDRVRITVQLVSASSETNLWAESYERNAGDVLTLQAEVARAIAQAISVRLSASESERLTAPGAVDPRAIDAYLRGRALWNQRTEAAVREALRQFESATRLAPGFALGFAGVADSHIILGVYGFDPPREAFQAAKAAAAHAIELDATVGEPHASLGDILFHYDWDWEASDGEHRKAIELSPGFATAYHWRSEPLLLLGRIQESLDSLRRARSLDPLSMTIRYGLGRTMWLSGDRDGAMTELRNAVALDPRYPGTRIELARQLLSAGRKEEAIAEARRVVESNPDHVPGIATLGLCLAATGRAGEARALLDRLNHEGERRFVSSLDRARIAAGLRDREAALGYLAAAVKAREGYLPFLDEYEEFDFLRGDARFEAILRQIGIPLETRR